MLPALTVARAMVAHGNAVNKAITGLCDTTTIFLKVKFALAAATYLIKLKFRRKQWEAQVIEAWSGELILRLVYRISDWAEQPQLPQPRRACVLQ